MSRSGVLLVGALPHPAGNAADLTLKSPSGSLEVRLAAAVVRDDPGDEEDPRRVALEFRDVTPEQHERLEALIARVLEAQTPGPLESLRPGAAPPEIRKALEEIPLPHRIALAVRAGVREREYLRLDTKAAVLESLARNPSLLPADVRALVTSPHILPTTLEHIAGDSRWTPDEEIQLCLACHPKIPLTAAQRILERMKPPTMRKILHRSGVQPAIRERVVRLLGRS